MNCLEKTYNNGRNKIMTFPRNRQQHQDKRSEECRRESEIPKAESYPFRPHFALLWKADSEDGKAK